MSYNVMIYPSPFLLKKAREVTDAEFAAGAVDGEPLSQLADRMTSFCLKTGNVAGIAAPQIGVGLRIAVFLRQDKTAMAIFNPVISEASREMEPGKEGCLSLPGVVVTVKRHKRIAVQYRDALGKPETMQAEGMEAREIQHEIDHIDGQPGNGD